MASDYTDEDLFSRYYAATLDARQAAEMVAVHRESYPMPDPTRGGDWTGTTPAERKEGAFQALERAAHMPDGPEKQALIDHALGGARVREAAPVKVSR
jgi:hypothetical protein